MSLTNSILEAMAVYLSDQLESDPPELGVAGVVKVGNYQDNPEASPAVITVHVGDPYDTTFYSVRVTEQLRGAMERQQLLGGYVEIGGGTMWRLRFSAYIDYFFTRTGEDQDEARQKALDLLEWLEDKLANAQPWIIGAEPENNRTPVSTLVVDSRPTEEGGPPASYIWRGRVRFEVLTYAENSLA